jgi:GT2 family glycosyltransferase
VAAAPPDAGDGPSTGRATDRRIAAIVVNWHQEQASIECARRLLSWTRLAPSVTVVDNDSGEAAVANLRESLSGARVLASPTNLGFGAAVNRALEGTDSEFALLLNNDAILEEDDAARLVEFLDTRSDAAVAGPVLEATIPPHEVIAAGGRDLARHGRTHSSAAERASELRAGRPYAVDYVPGTAAILRREPVAEIGGFEEEYFFSGEMADLCARLVDAGLGSYIVPAARARHDLAAAGDRRAVLYAYYSLRNRFLFVRRRRTARAARVLKWALRGSLRALAAGRMDRSRALGLAVMDGLRGRFGPANERLSR